MREVQIISKMSLKWKIIDGIGVLDKLKLILRGGISVSKEYQSVSSEFWETSKSPLRVSSIDSETSVSSFSQKLSLSVSLIWN